MYMLTCECVCSNGRTFLGFVCDEVLFFAREKLLLQKAARNGMSSKENEEIMQAVKTTPHIN